MGRWSRDELEDAFSNFQNVALAAGTSGDWNDWADLFTEDATYVEHTFGTFGGREAIRRWITETMAAPGNNEMKYFPIEWYVIDEEKGWIICQVWNRMADPGDGSLHQEYNFTLLKYAGGGRFSYEEDIYNPAHMGEMMEAYFQRKRELTKAEEFLSDHHMCVLVTLRRDGRPQSSNVVYDFADGVIRISVTSDRAKTRNLARDPRASVHVSSGDFWQYVVAEGTAELSPVSETPGDAVGRELATLNEAVTGEPHPDWDEFFQAMVDDRRQVIRIRPERFYGQVR